MITLDLNHMDKDVSRSKLHSMCNEIRLTSLYNSVQMVQEVEGDLVEIGVCRGGSSMCMAYSSLRIKKFKNILLYDTFAGMSEPCKHDTKIHVPNTSEEIHAKWENKQKGNHNEWCFGSLDEVKNNMNSTSYPKELISYHIGDITKETDYIPEKISVLRIDVDFYEPTRCALNKFYDRLEVGGVLILDDYGCWKGCKKAYDDFAEVNNIKTELIKIDKSASYFVKEEM